MAVIFLVSSRLGWCDHSRWEDSVLRSLSTAPSSCGRCELNTVCIQMNQCSYFACLKNLDFFTNISLQSLDFVKDSVISWSIYCIGSRIILYLVMRQCDWPFEESVQASGSVCPRIPIVLHTKWSPPWLWTFSPPRTYRLFLPPHCGVNRGAVPVIDVLRLSNGPNVRKSLGYFNYCDF